MASSSEPREQDWDRWALILIDVQKDFWTPGHERAFPDFAGHISSLLEFCRAEGIEVVHVHSRFRADRSDWMPIHKAAGHIPCVEGTGGDAVVPFAAPIAGEPIFVKQTFDAFQLPELAAYLRDRGKRVVLTAGLETSYCVLLSSAGACQEGFLTLLLEDCCADDPAFDQAATAGMLARYQGKLLYRASLAELASSHAQWTAKLAEIDNPPARS